MELMLFLLAVILFFWLQNMTELAQIKKTQ